MEAVNVSDIRKMAVFDVLWNQCEKELARVSAAIENNEEPSTEDMDLISSACVGLFRGVGLLGEHQRRGV